MSVPKNCVIFIGCNFKSRASLVGLHTKNGKASFQRRGGQRLKPSQRKTWPRATDVGFLIYSQKARMSRMLNRAAGTR